MLAGDVVAPVKGWLGGMRGLTQGATPSTAATATEARLRQRAAAKHLVEQPGYRWLLPSGGGNFSREQAGRQVQEWPDEVAHRGEATTAAAGSASPAAGGRREASNEKTEGMHVSCVHQAPDAACCGAPGTVLKRMA